MDTFIGYHYDIARGAFLRPETFCAALRAAAASGFRQFLPYLEHMIRLPCWERACPPCAYTLEQWRAFEDVATAAGLELVPHINVIGHTEQFQAAYPEYMGNPHEPELDVMLPAAQAWILEALDQFCAGSRARHFLIGGDEWQAPNRLLAQPGFRPGLAWVEQINRAVARLREHGRVPLVWHDMLLHYPEALERLSRDAVILFWFYDEDSGYPVLETFRAHGFRVVMAGGILEHGISRRNAAGFDLALAEAARRAAAGLLMTSWGDGRWEVQRMNIVLTGRRLRGEPWPAPVLQAVSLTAALERLPAASGLAAEWRRRACAALAAPAWEEFPEAAALFRATLAGDHAAVLALYEQHQYAAGPLHAALRAAAQAAPAAGRAQAVHQAPRRTVGRGAVGGAVGLQVEERPREGAALRFRNGTETFVVYPKYGGSLQAWTVDGVPIIEHTLPAFFGRPRGQALPGGYRSQSGAGGLRPIWALGTHSNPCILWQYPQAWRVVEETAEAVAVELSLELPHVACRCCIGVRRGTPGFRLEARACNRLAGAYGAFSFNLPLCLEPADAEVLAFAWEEEGGQRTSLREAGTTVLALPARRCLQVTGSRWTVRIDSAAAETAGYWVDWSVGYRYVTPDLHGVYRRRAVGEETVARWTFVAAVR